MTWQTASSGFNSLQLRLNQRLNNLLLRLNQKLLKSLKLKNKSSPIITKIMTLPTTRVMVVKALLIYIG